MQEERYHENNDQRRQQDGLQPFSLRPAVKHYLWGGTRLQSEYGVAGTAPLAEAWVCAAHPHGSSTVASGPHAGQPLDVVLQEHPDYLGDLANADNQLPILIKLIDAKEPLSIQVHPTDAFASRHENGQRGKDEMWYMLDAKAGATVRFGLHRTESTEHLRHALAQGRFTTEMQEIPVRKGGVFFVPAGTIHSIGSGIVLAEIQQNSDLTYRLYDYDRVDRRGRTRPLQIEKALAAATLTAAPAPRQPMRILRYRPGMAAERLARGNGFEVHRLLLRTEAGQTLPYHPDPRRFRVLLCIEGRGEIGSEAEPPLALQKGSCVFLPAGTASQTLRGEMELLEVRV